MLNPPLNTAQPSSVYQYNISIHYIQCMQNNLNASWQQWQSYDATHAGDPNEKMKAFQTQYIEPHCKTARQPRPSNSVCKL